MKKIVILQAILLTAFIGCKKNENIPSPQPSLPADDARPVLLKEVVAQSLPSPYFHFTYDEHRYVKQINFASGFAIYNLEYENKRVKKMTNIQNNNSLLYTTAMNRLVRSTSFRGKPVIKFSATGFHIIAFINWRKYVGLNFPPIPTAIFLKNRCLPTRQMATCQPLSRISI